MRSPAFAALILAASLPAAACAAGTNNVATTAALGRMVATYGALSAVRVIEHFENGAVATVDVMAPGQYRIAETGGESPALIMRIATQPAAGAETAGAFNVTELGRKTIAGVPAQGYKIVAADGSYTETLWTDAKRTLPMTAHIETAGHSVDVLYGDYNNSLMIATVNGPK